MKIGTRREFEWLKALLAFIFVMNAVDGVLTVGWIFTGNAEEANPLMDHLIDLQPVIFMGVKLLLVALGSYLLWRFRHQRVAVVAMFALFLVYYGILVYHANALAMHFFPEQFPVQQAEMAQAPPQLVAEDELKGLEAELLLRVEGNRTRACIRPVFSGTPLEGPADEAIVHFLKGPEVTDCSTAVGKAREALDEYLAADQPRAKTVSDVLQACGKVPEALREPLRHANACCPFLAGRRGLPPLVDVVRTGRGLAAVIRNLLSTGRVEQALNVGLDWLLFCQDLSRGRGAPLIAASVGIAASKPLLEETLSDLLNHPQALPDPVLKELPEKFTLLLAGEPEYEDLLAYERDGLVLQMVLPGLKPEGWQPPGGFDEDYTPVTSAHQARELPGVTGYQQWALLWLASERTYEEVRDACPAGTPLALCYERLGKLADALSEQVRVSPLKRWLTLLFARNPNRQLRSWLVEILQGVATPSHRRYLSFLAQRRFHLAALRLHATLLLQKRRGDPLDLDELASQPRWQPLLQDPAANHQAMRLTHTDEETLLLQPAALFEGLDGEDYQALRHEIILH